MRIAFVGDSLTSGRPGCSYVRVLRDRLPAHTLVNWGVGNDTAISLYRRIARRRGAEQFDVAFIWVGVNDVAPATTWPMRVNNALRRQPRPRNVDEFAAYYERALDVLCRLAGRVVAVSPAIRGEDADSRWNNELETMAGVVKGMTDRYEQVSYLDVRTPLFRALDGKPKRDILPKTHQVLWDALTLWRREAIDRKAAERGLHVTLDGVHLNGRGAEIVAETFLKAIEQQHQR